MLFLGLKKWKIINSKHCSNATRHTLKVLVAINNGKIAMHDVWNDFWTPQLLATHFLFLSMKSEFSSFFSITLKEEC